MRYLSVCSGIEAATVAWHPLGWEPVLFSEIEAFPRAVLKYRQRARDARRGVRPGRVPLWGDFTTIRPRHLRRLGIDPDIDLLVGGTPCQSFSVAGLRGGMDDPRGGLALEYLKLARRLRPRWLVWENVPGVLSSNGGRDFGAFLGGLAELGYGFAYRILDAQHFGVPQRRRRVFVVGHLGDWRRAAAVLFERHSLSGHPAPRSEAREGVAARAGQGAALSGYRETGQGWWTEGQMSLRAGPGGMPENVVAYQATGNGLWRAGLGPLASSDDNGTNPIIAPPHRGDGFDASEDGTGRGTPLVPVGCFDDPRRFDARGVHRGGEHGELHPPLNQTAGQQVIAFGWQNAAAQGDDVRVEVSPTLDKSKTPAIAFSCKDHGADAGEIAPTLRAMGHGLSNANAGGQVAVAIQERALSDSDTSGPGGKGWQEGVAYTMEARHRPQHVATGIAVRRITPTEAERLQGFPDGYTLVPYRGKPAKDGPRYKALGNSMAVPCMAWIGGRIAVVDALPGLTEGCT